LCRLVRAVFKQKTRTYPGVQGVERKGCGRGETATRKRAGHFQLGQQRGTQHVSEEGKTACPSNPLPDNLGGGHVDNNFKSGKAGNKAPGTHVVTLKSPRFESTQKRKSGCTGGPQATGSSITNEQEKKKTGDQSRRRREGTQ